MIIRVKYNEINEFSSYLKDKSKELDNLLDEYKNQIEGLSTVWIGKDSQAFISEADKYLETIKQDDEKLLKMGELIKKINDNYKEKENDWSNKIKKENLE